MKKYAGMIVGGMAFTMAALSGCGQNVKVETTAAAVQTQDTLDALRMWMTIPSVILLIVGIFVFKRFYKLDDTRMEEIKSKLN